MSYVKNEPEYAEDSQDTVLKSNIAILEEAKLNILQAQKKQKEHYDKKHANPLSYSISTKVLLKDFKRKKTKGGKLLIRWKGPYTIVKLLGRGTYMLSDADSNTVRAIASHIKPFISESGSDSAKAFVELEREVIDVVKHNCSCVWEQLNSSHLLRLWRTGTSKFHHEAKEDDEAFDVSEMHAFFTHVY